MAHGTIGRRSEVRVEDRVELLTLVAVGRPANELVPDNAGCLVSLATDAAPNAIARFANQRLDQHPITVDQMERKSI